MPTNPNMVAIQTVTVGAGGASSISFTNIPQTYTDLVILLSGRQSAVGGTNVNMRFNGSTSAYTNTDVISAAGTAVSERTVLGTSSIKIGFIPDNTNYTTSTFSNQYVYIPNYAGSNNKSVSTDNAMENNSTSVYFGLFAGLWSNSSAITSIVLTCENGNFVQYSSATLYGVLNYSEWQIQEGAKARGGTVTSDANYWYHTFTTSGTFTPIQSLTADYLVIAGGAGGGTGNGGGGGGAGGFVYTSGDSLTSTSYTVTVGAGGAGATDGNNSIFRSSTALKGGRGGNATGAGIGGSGTYGSGGGNGRDSGSSSGGAGTSGQGFAGGGPAIGNNANGGGGGGGAGGTGYPGKEDSFANNGGLGGIGISTYSSWGLATSTGENVNGTYYYAGGGGGSPVTGNALGGLGGGGRSATFNLSGSAATSGITASGGGGGGGGNTGNWSSVPGNGGSGVVIIRYAK